MNNEIYNKQQGMQANDVWAKNVTAKNDVDGLRANDDSPLQNENNDVRANNDSPLQNGNNGLRAKNVSPVRNENNDAPARKNPLPQRKSVRLDGFDYSSEGLYFITICCKNFNCLFGEIYNGELQLNNAGKMAEKCWLEIPNHYPQVQLHEFIIMPNHVHGIIEIVLDENDVEALRANDDTAKNDVDGLRANNDSPLQNENNDVRANNDSPLRNGNNDVRANDESPLRNGNNGLRAKNVSPLPRGTSNTIGAMVRGFKIGVTKWMKQNTTIVDVWQRGFYEHVIKTEKSHESIGNYIIENPLNWSKDKFYVGANHHSPAQMPITN